MSDTTEILSGAPAAPEDAPAAAGATASTSKSRSRGGTGLSSLLMPELQRIAQTLAIPGAGRMRKSQLIEAIEARQGGGPRQETSAARSPARGSRPAAGGQASRAVPPDQQGSDQRAASAGAGAARLQKQDAMEPDTHSRPGIGASAQPGLGAGAPAGIGADGAAQQQLSFYEEADSAARRDSVTQDGAAPATAAEAAQGDTQRGDRRRRNGQPSRVRDQGSRDQSVRDQGSRDQGSREGGREQVSRDQGSREQSRDHGNRDQSVRDQGRDSRDQGGDRRDQGRDGRDQGGDRRDQGRDGRDQGGDRREPAAAGRGPGGDQFRDDDGDGRRGRSRDRFRNRNRRRERQSDPEPVIAEDDVLIPIAGILDVLESQGYAFVRTTGYLPGPNDVYVSLSQVRKHGLRKGDVIEGAV
ncbi:MAG TPA: Rho termination factor N-terminal domain-containing protein, partial [Streptosporangiaceae bacterium]|nr:Rho termination factor N-terminal domain-containing protein [Streptosporangiaceae bacterium]